MTTWSDGQLIAVATILLMALQSIYKWILAAVEKDLVPDFLLRRGIRYLLSQRVQQVLQGPPYSLCAHCMLSYYACKRPWALDVTTEAQAAQRHIQKCLFAL